MDPSAYPFVAASFLFSVILLIRYRQAVRQLQKAQRQLDLECEEMVRQRLKQSCPPEKNK